MDNNTKLELKNQALLERVSEITTQDENRIADLRVEVTLLSRRLQELETENEGLKNELVQAREADPAEITEDSSE